MKYKKSIEIRKSTTVWSKNMQLIKEKGQVFVRQRGRPFGTWIDLKNVDELIDDLKEVNLLIDSEDTKPEEKK